VDGIDRFRWLELPSEEKGTQKPAAAEQAEDAGKNEQDYLRMARDYYRQGFFEEALRAYSAALRFDESLVEAWSGQVRALTDLGELHEARVWVEKALGQFPNDPQLLSTQAWVLARSGRIDEAMTSSDQALTSGTESQVVWLDRGTILLLQGNEEAAVYCFNKLLEKDDDDWYWLTRAGIAFLEAQKPARAQKLLQMAVEQNPAASLAWLGLARSQQELGHNDQVGECLERVKELDEHHPGLVRFRGMVQRKKRPCLVASCCFTTPGAPQVLVLRRWRDRVLLSRHWGRNLVRTYDHHSPGMVAWLHRHPGMIALTRSLLAVAAALVRAMEPCWNHHPTGTKEE